MAYKTHHVLIFSKDPVVLAGAGLKIARHQGARVYLANNINSKPFPPPAFKQSDPAPWKLHVIEHGSEGSVGALRAGIGWQKMADWILGSGIADQAGGGLPPLVRLDVCSSGIPGSSEIVAGFHAATVVEKLAARLLAPLKGRRLSIEGCKGTCVGPWAAEAVKLGTKTYKRKQRQVIDPKAKVLYLVTPDVNDYKKWKVSSKMPPHYYGPYTPDDYAGYLWTYIGKKLSPASLDTSKTTADGMAKDAWSKYRHAVQEFHRMLTDAHTATGGGVFLQKSKKSDYLKISHLNPR